MIFSIVMTAVVGLATIKNRLDNLNLELARMVVMLDKFDVTIRLHDKYIAVLLNNAGLDGAAHPKDSA